MRNRWLPLLLLLTAITWIGCGGSKTSDTDTPLTTTAHIDNNAPGAASAPAAPGPGPDVPRPGKPVKR